MDETLQVPALERSLEVDNFEAVRADDGTVRLSFTASSEYAVERFFGSEVLVHDAKAIRLERANRGALPLLFNHDMDDVVGMVDALRLDGKRLRCDAHLFDTPRAQDVDAMVRGGLRNVSIRYRLHKVEEEPKKQMTRVTDWEPLEVSIVSIPADPTVGIGRSDDGPKFAVRMVRAAETLAEPAEPKRKAEMTDVVTNAPETAEGTQQQPRIEVRSPLPVPNAVEMEKRRKQSIENLCRLNNLDDNYRDMFVGGGFSVDEVSDQILRIHEERGKLNPQPLTRIGMTGREVQRFSLSRAILACATNNWKDAGFEAECSRTVAEKLGRAQEPHKFLVPFEVLQREVQVGQRDANVATPGQGGYLVATDNVGFIEMLRNRSVAFRMGARRLSGLQGNVTIPRQSAAATAYWLASETTQITESQQTFVQIAMSPKTAGAYTEISRNLLMQSNPSAEGIITDDLAQVVALAADLAVLNGSGNSGQPTGILNTSGIGSVTGTSLAYAGILEFQTDVATANVTPVAGGYVTTPAVAGLLMARQRFTSTDTPLWDGNIWNGQVSGFPAMSSNQIPSATMIFGDWQEVVVGEWGVLEVETNPFADFRAGIVGVRALYSLDVGVRRPFAFSAAASIT